MNAAEMIRAAIDKLTRLRDNSNDNPTAGSWISRPSVTGTAQVLIDYATNDYEPQVIAEEVYHADAELMVTLHATIDAQLFILRDSLPAAENALHLGDGVYVTGGFIGPYSLARAILGEQVDA